MAPLVARMQQETSLGTTMTMMAMPSGCVAACSRAVHCPGCHPTTTQPLPCFVCALQADRSCDGAGDDDDDGDCGGSDGSFSSDDSDSYLNGAIVPRGESPFTRLAADAGMVEVADLDGATPFSLDVGTSLGTHQRPVPLPARCVHHTWTSNRREDRGLSLRAV